MKAVHRVAVVLLVIAGIFILFYPLTGSENLPCISMLLIIMGLLFLLFQTGPAAGAVSSKSGVNTAMISREIVVEDSASRWRRKSSDEIRLGLVFLIAGLVSLPITVFISFFFRM